MAVLILVIALIVILIGAELFTNGIEWVGRKLDLAEGRWVRCLRPSAPPCPRR